MRRSVTVVAVGALVFGLVACSDDGSIRDGTAPRIEVSDGTNPITRSGTVTVSSQLPTRLEVANTGSGPLQIREIVLESVPAGAFTLISSPMPSATEPVTVMPDDLEHEFTIIYNAPEGAVRAAGKVTIHTNRTLDGFDTFSFNLTPESAQPRLIVQPMVVDFDTVGESSTSTKRVSLLNTGAADLLISSFYLSGHPGFSVDLAGQLWTVNAQTSSTGVSLEQPVVIAPGAATQVDVTYTSSGPEPAEAQLVLVSNDPTSGAGTTVQMFANVAGPCINVSPARVEFGGKLVGQESTINLQITSCGDRPLEISALTFVNDAAGAFDMNALAVGVLPVSIPTDQSITLPVTYFPQAVSPVGAGGVPQLDMGLLRITSNAYVKDYDVELSGFGTDGSCPTAVITVAQGEEVIPNTILNLSASNSTSAGSTITGWEWSVIAPAGSASVFLPSPFVENPRFEAAVIGEYIFRLRVYNAVGTPSCDLGTYTVYVTSPEAIHVELVWTTPGDPDETDTGFVGNRSAGSDVDLHFIHPLAVDSVNPEGWFHSRYDTYWANPNPNWGGPGTADDPSLDRDDTDGAGPENLHLAIPENGRTYTVGIHYWDDWNYGHSFATVRVYVYGQLRMQWNNVRLNNVSPGIGDMWECCTIAWPSGAVTKIETAGPGSNVPFIRQAYSEPFPFPF